MIQQLDPAIRIVLKNRGWSRTLSISPEWTESKGKDMILGRDKRHVYVYSMLCIVLGL